MPILTRSTGGSAVSNYETNIAGRPVQFYEAMYSTGGAQEWIVLPDCNPIGVSISFPDGGSASLQATNSPPSTLGLTDQNGNPLFASSFQGASTRSPQVYSVELGLDYSSGTPTPIYTTSTPAYVVVQGATAIRLYVNSGSPVISARA